MVATKKRRRPSTNGGDDDEDGGGRKKKIAKPMGICSFCMGDEDKNAAGIPEDMIHCAECGNSGHPSCLRYSAKLVKKIRTIRWQCLDCKRCLVCRRGDDSLLFCDLCDTAIHPKCCNPPLHSVPKGTFACPRCRPPKKDKVNNLQRKKSVQKAVKYLRKKPATTEVDVSDTKRKLHLDLSKYKTPPAFLHDSLPDNVAANDVYHFLDARHNASKLIADCSDQFHYSSKSIENDPTNTRWPPYIVFGSDVIQTWYSSSYPQEYARVPRLFICEFCLKYMKCEQVYERHRKTCQTFHPPANEIYHKDDLSVFEVDGNINRIYCQNLCLLAKLFLDHKTLYYDVEPFLFYVLTKNDSHGCHFLGYFSKEKHCPEKYNLSCIMVLPVCQRRGYGRFLIELSYLFSQKENQIGTPERPLSVHGAQTYEAFWRLKIVRLLLIYFKRKRDRCVLKDLVNETGISVDDILDTLQNLGMLTMKSNEKLVIHVDTKQLESIINMEKTKHAHWVSLDSEFLRFTPVLKPFLVHSMESQRQDIEVVFKEIEADPAGPCARVEGDVNDGSHPVRRRKGGRKRRSISVRGRSSHKHAPGIAHEDDDHSQEYISRRRTSSIDEPVGEEEFATPVSSPTIPSTLKQFLRKLPVDGISVEPSINGDSKHTFSSPLPFKKRAWTSSDLLSKEPVHPDTVVQSKILFPQ